MPCLLLQIVGLPIAASIVIGFTRGARKNHRPAWITIATLAYTTVLLGIVGLRLYRGDVILEKYFLGPDVSLNLLADGLSLPVALIPNCAATRHIEFTLDGSGPAQLEPPKLEDWPAVTWEAGSDAKRIDLDRVTKEDLATLQPGDRVLLSGKLLTGRDAAHKRIADLLARGEPLPEGVDFNNRFIYYVGPVDPVGDEVVGPAGPTTATRMDKFTELMLGETGLIGMVGKSERGPAAIESIKKHGAVYLMAVGGAAYLVAKAIRASRMVAFEDLGMEAIREFEVEEMPVTVAVDSRGESVHLSGPAEWRVKIGKIPLRGGD
jgi:fumarate hydratase class I